jgi:hypothetical protein
MARNRPSLAHLAPALALLLVPATARPQDAHPNFTGTYHFVPKRSDDVREAIERAVGPDYTVGSKKSEQARVWIREWLEGIVTDPDKHILAIEQDARTFKSGVGDNLHVFYFGREATSLGPAGGNLKVSVSWNGDQLLTEERQAKGKGQITALYTLVPDGKTLLVAWRLEHESLREPLDVRLAFERLQP